MLIIARIKLPRLGRLQLDVLLLLAILLPPMVVGIFDPGGLFHWWLD